MHLPGKDDSIWYDIVTGKKTCQLKFLAARILLGRLTRSVEEDDSEENITAGIDQLYALYANNRNMPSAMDDLAALSR
jgi:hypothetical protein